MQSSLEIKLLAYGFMPGGAGAVGLSEVLSDRLRWARNVPGQLEDGTYGFASFVAADLYLLSAMEACACGFGYELFGCGAGQDAPEGAVVGQKA